MTRPEARRLVALLPALLLPGCLYVQASGHFGSALDPEVIARIVPGRTTKGEVLELLGPPEEFLRSEVVGSLGDETTRISGAVALGNRARDAFTYQRDELSARGSILLLYNRVRSEIVSDLLVVFFDGEDRVREVSVRWAETRR
jgi:hypothetical protein